MANVYVRSGAGGAGTGADWTNAYTTLAAALTAKAAGDVFYVSEDHAESTAAAITLTSPGTDASPCQIICVNHSGSVPPVSADISTAATVTTTGNSNISFAGVVSCCYGITFHAGSAASGTANLALGGSVNASWTFKSCTLRVGTTGASSRISISSGGCIFALIDCILRFGSTSQAVAISAQNCVLSMRGGSVSASGSVPTTFLLSSNSSCRHEFFGVDLSVFGSGTNLCNVSGTGIAVYFFTDCKLGSSVTVSTGTIAGRYGSWSRLVNCDSADTNYRFYYQDYFGTITQETTIKRTGGASDGATGFSRKFVSGSTTSAANPLYGPWFKWWAAAASVTAAIETVTDNVTLKDNECWVEVESITTSSFPLGTFANDGPADPLATGTNQTTSSEVWTTTGLTTPVYQTLSKAVTTAKAGWVRARLVLAKASTTVYVCPKVLSNSTYQYMDDDGTIVNTPNIPSGSAGMLFTTSEG